MGRYKKRSSKTRIGSISAGSRKKSSGYRYGSSRPRVKSAGDVGSLRRTRNKKGIRAFIQRYYKLLAVAVFVIVIAGLSLILLLSGKDTTASKDQPIGPSGSSMPTPPEAQEAADFDEDAEYAYEGVDESILEGMAGTDESMFSEEEDEELSDALFAEEGIRIGVTIGNIITKNDELLLSKLEEVTNIAESEKIVYEVYYYNAGGDYNQQLQDVRSLIKNEVDVIIIGSTNEESFSMVTSMAAKEDIPVVAYDAPVKTGYTVNVVADQAAWSKKYIEFISQKVPAGNIVQILDDKESESDTLRNTAIQSALSNNPEVTLAVKTYPVWKKNSANDALEALLDEYKQIDGIVAEEGMAKGILDAYIAAAKEIEDITTATDVLPRVMCADATAGFIKTWYALKNEGVDITPDPPEGEEVDETAPKIMLTAGFGEFVVCAQPKPIGIGAAAFEIALKIAEGYEWKSGTSTTYEFSVKTFITDYNLSEYYEQIRDEKNSYVISEKISEQEIESLFNPLDEATE